MNALTDKRPHVLIVTELFPSTPTSYTGTFIVSQLHALVPYYRFTVFVPYVVPLSRYLATPMIQKRRIENHDVYFLKHADAWRRLRSIFVRRPIVSEQYFVYLKESMSPRLVALARAIHLQSPLKLVHGHEAFIGDEASVIGQSLGLPSIVTLHGLYNLHEQLWGHNAMERIIRNLRVATHLLFVSRVASDSYYLRLPAPRPPLDVIPNGIGEKSPSALPREWIERIRGRTIILGVGFFTPEKRFNLLIGAAAALRQQFGNTFVVVLIGRGEEQQHYRGMIESLKLGDQLLIVGPVAPTAIPAWYAAAAIVAHPSVVESFSMVALEAMTFMKPVIITSTIGLAEYLNPNEAFIVPPDNQAALIQALTDLLAHPDLRETIGQAGYRRSHAFSWPTIIPRLRSIYDRYIT